MSRYEKHRCPQCLHIFEFEMRGDTYAIGKENDVPHVLYRCPKCGIDLFISSNSVCGCIAELVPHDDIRVLAEVDKC